MTLWTGDYMQHFQSTSNSLEKIYMNVYYISLEIESRCFISNRFTYNPLSLV